MNKLLFTPIFLFPNLAMAHHPLNGMPMETFNHGLLSGVGHTVLGIDHLFFIAILGISALFLGRRLIAPLAYMVAMLAGCLLTFYGFDLPMKEAFIALSLLVVGGICLIGREISLPKSLVTFAFFGLFHGSAFGEAVMAQEAGVGLTVLSGYLLGLGLVQYCIALLFGFAMSHLLNAREVSHVNGRLAGAMVAGVGLFLTVDAFELQVLSVFGMG